MIPYGLFDAIPKVFYLLTMSVLSIIDLFQLLMRKLAGLDCYYVGEGESAVAQSGDIVYEFLTGIFSGKYPILSTVFWGLVILGFILLFLSTIIAIIRSEYTTEKADNGKGKIMFKAFKSVVFFALVPIVTLVGVYLANVVLVAVDKATTPNTNNYSYLDTSKLQAVKVQSYSFGVESTTETYVTYSLFGFRNDNNKDSLGNSLPYGTTTTTFSGTIFKAAAFNANRVRSTANNEWTDIPGLSKNFAQLISTNMVTTFDGLFQDENNDPSTMAAKIDVAFADNVVFKTPEKLNFNDSIYIKDKNNLSGDPFPSQKDNEQVCADKFNVQLVWYYYDLWQFNYIIGVGAAVICATIFINIIFGLMRRIIEMVGLFLIAPPLIGLMPLDNEKAFGSWRSKFIAKALMAYGAIGGMNIIFVLLPEIQKIKFFNIGPIDWIVDTLLVLVALLAIKEFIALVSGLISADDANAVGEKVGKDLGDLAGKAVKVGATVAGVGVAGAKFAGKAALGAGRAIKAKSMFKHRGNVDGKASAAERRAHRDEDMAAAEQSVLDSHYEKYRQNSQRVRDAENGAIGRYGKEYMSKLKENDGQKYQELIDQQLRINSDIDAKSDKDFGNKVDADFIDKQMSRKVTKSDLLAQTDRGQRLYQKYDNKNEIRKYKHDAKYAATDDERRYAEGQLRMAKKNKHADSRAYVGHNIEYAGKPFVGSTKNFVGEVGSILTSNSFVEGFMGKDKDTLIDSAYRLAGTTKKDHEKLKAKQKELKAQQEQLKAQQEAFLNALRKFEAEKHKH